MAKTLQGHNSTANLINVMGHFGRGLGAQGTHFPLYQRWVAND